MRQQRAIEEKSGLLKNLETVEDLKIAPLPYFSDTLVTFSDVVPIFDGKNVCQPISFTVKQGERIALDGKKWFWENEPFKATGWATNRTSWDSCNRFWHDIVLCTSNKSQFCFLCHSRNGSVFPSFLHTPVSGTVAASDNSFVH